MVADSGALNELNAIKIRCVETKSDRRYPYDTV